MTGLPPITRAEFQVITLFPELLEGYLSGSILGRAIAADLVSVSMTNPRDYALNKHKSVDDSPFGGGPGMVMAVPALAAAIRAVRAESPKTRVVLLGPAGRRFDQECAAEYAAYGSIAFVCGRYEGIDERVATHLVDEELSLGDFVLTGGELAALAVIDAVSRLIPGVLGNAQGAHDESFTGSPLLEHPQYTRPRVWEEHDVPPVLLSGDHGAIAKWRAAKRIERTQARRPDLYERWQRSQKEVSK